jgi:hypothetical protein
MLSEKEEERKEANRLRQNSHTFPIMKTMLSRKSKKAFWKSSDKRPLSQMEGSKKGQEEYQEYIRAPAGKGLSNSYHQLHLRSQAGKIYRG